MKHKDTVIVFLFDRNHLAGFEVFYYSLHKTRSLMGVPMVLLTTDEVLLENPLLRRIFTRIIYLAPEKLVPFQAIDREAVETRHRHELVAKYTFLKFNIFSEVQAKRILYFDVDMVCLQNIDGLLRLNDADFAAARPLAKRKLLDAQGKRKTEPQCEQVVERFCRDCDRYATITPRIWNRLTLNSGVLLIGEKLIGSTTRDGLLSRAKSGNYGFEQHVLRDYIQDRGDIRVRYLESGYNFPRRALDTTSVEYFSRIRHRIRILHFNGGHPWKRGNKQSYVELLWWNLYMDSRPFIEALREPRVARFLPVRLRRAVR